MIYGGKVSDVPNGRKSIKHGGSSPPTFARMESSKIQSDLHSDMQSMTEMIMPCNKDERNALSFDW
ncbi:hypothetical protein HY413_03970 [Candidatus Kaiserbacteria bacterium]|nr:hypothetical protein [Candidatus Kaiserbacteria bacterium]